MKTLLLILIVLSINIEAKWPDSIIDITYASSMDNSLQPMKLYSAKGNKERPLLLALHSWSGDYKQTGWQIEAVQWCLENNWHFIHPNFRGPNNNSEACASDKAVQDIIDAVQYMQKNYHVDKKRIYLIGSSGGGHMALIMAGRSPELWAGVSAWVPISDINQWWNECNNTRHDKYARHIEKILGANPTKNQLAITQAKRRSPITYLDKAREVNIDISAGISDGRKGGSVPFSHTLNAFNAIVEPKHKIPENLITEFYKTQIPPNTLVFKGEDPLFGKKKVLSRKFTQHTRVNIFDGGHQIITHVALNWLKAQRKGNSAVWKPLNISKTSATQNSHQSGL